MTYVDSAVLNVIERACHAFQRLTGRTNVWLAAQLTNLSIIVYFIWMGLYASNIDILPRVAVLLFCATLIYVLLQTILRVPIEAYEAQAYRRVANGFRNPRRGRDALLRIPFLTLSLVLWYPVGFVYVTLETRLAPLAYSLIVLTTAVLYLLACDPLPPCPGKLREWLRGPEMAPLPTPQAPGGDAAASASGAYGVSRARLLREGRSL